MGLFTKMWTGYRETNIGYCDTIWLVAERSRYYLGPEGARGRICFWHPEGETVSKRRATWQELWRSVVTLQGGSGEKIPNFTLLRPSHFMSMSPVDRTQQEARRWGAHWHSLQRSASQCIEMGGEGAGVVNVEEKGFSAQAQSAIILFICLSSCHSPLWRQGLSYSLL